MKKQFIIKVVFVLCFLSGCASYIPDKEMKIAEAALKAAKEANAPVLAPRLYQIAEEAFQSALRAKQEREFTLAKEFALKAQTFSERAENFSVLKKEKGE